jgi:hypothetical protein
MRLLKILPLALTMPLVLLTLLSMPSVAVAADKYKQIRQSLDKAEARFKTQMEGNCKQFLGVLDAARDQAMKAGEIENWRKLNDEYEAFQQSNTLPSSVDCVEFRREATMAFEQVLSQYQARITNALKSKDIEIAEKLEEDRDEFESKFDQEFPKTRFHWTKWSHATGKFEKVNRQEWVEHTPNTRYTFQEVERNPQGILLYDQTRNVTLILKVQHCFLREKSGRLKLIFNGKFDN